MQVKTRGVKKVEKLSGLTFEREWNALFSSFLLDICLKWEPASSWLLVESPSGSLNLDHLAAEQRMTSKQVAVKECYQIMIRKQKWE